MQSDEYRKLFELEGSYWWYVGRRAIIRTMLASSVRQRVQHAADIGCGTGMNLGLLGEFSDHVVGVDSSAQALAYCRMRGYADVVLVPPGAPLPFSSGTIELATMLDVLEHVDDEAAILRDVHRVLVPGGYLVVSVPAYKFLWSEHDIALHHQRRYTRSGVSRLLAESGFRVRRASYCISFSFLLIVFYRIGKGIINRLRPSRPHTSHVELPGFVNSFFIGVLGLEARLLRFMNFPFGTSVIIVAEKG